ncbi:hypothetical protein FRC00_002460 [Tulasnella sp. 408]|nr:hypothetical protein FRC00_002460 [Tulasnella sp. 408]
MNRDAFLDSWPSPVPYRDPEKPEESDLLQLLIPHMHRKSRAVKWKYVDPRLWLTLIRLFWADTLPPTFRKYPLPLADPYLPYIQYIDPTPDFSLIVVLDLRKKKELTDESIIWLRALHQLAVLEISNTAVSNAGVAKLAEALRVDEEDGAARGPWRLRVLGLANTLVDTMVESSLRAFPLLSVVDLRDSKCKARPVIHGWQQHDILQSDRHTDLFDPAPPDSRMRHLGEISSKYDRLLFPSSQPPYIIDVKGLYHPPPPKHAADDVRGGQFSEDNSYFILSETGKSTWGNTQQIEERRKAIKMRNSIFLDREAFPDPFKAAPNAKLISVGNFRPMADDTALTEAEMLQEIRIGAYNEHAALLKCAEADRARRVNREEIERKRDPDCLNSRERLNRTLVLVRIPPSYDELDAAVRKKVEARNRLEAIKAASSGSSDSKKRGTNSEEVGMVDKRRKLGQGAIWGEIVSTAKGRGSTVRQQSSLPDSSSSRISKLTQSRNPFAKVSKGDSKKKLLSE